MVLIVPCCGWNHECLLVPDCFWKHFFQCALLTLVRPCKTTSPQPQQQTAFHYSPRKLKIMHNTTSKARNPTTRGKHQFLSPTRHLQRRSSGRATHHHHEPQTVTDSKFIDATVALSLLYASGTWTMTDTTTDDEIIQISTPLVTRSLHVFSQLETTSS